MRIYINVKEDAYMLVRDCAYKPLAMLVWPVAYK